MDDVFNEENESFMQETRLITNEYSVNLPTRFYYKKKWHDGWINVVLPQRGSIVVGFTGQREELLCHQPVHQAADRERLCALLL